MPRIFLVLLMCSCLSIISKAQQWELEKDEEGIQVSTTLRPGASMKSYRVQMDLNVPTQEIVDAILNVSNYPTWMKDCEESRVLEKTESGIIAYYVAGAPWPVAARDNISSMEVKELDNGFLIAFSQLADFLPLKDDFVRLQECNGYWKVEELSDGMSRLTQEVHVDPGGRIPAWLVNMTVVQNPFDSFSKLRDRLGG